MINNIDEVVVRYSLMELEEFDRNAEKPEYLICIKIIRLFVQAAIPVSVQYDRLG